MILSESNLDHDSMRCLVLEVIKENNFNQYGGIVNGVANKLVEHRYSSETNIFSTSSPSRKEMSERDGILVSEIIWDLIIQRVLTIGLDTINAQWPFLRLTEYGKKVVNQTDAVIIYDIDGMCERLVRYVPNIDADIKKYFYECLNTYRIDAIFASSVMLGCCAEKGVYILFDSYLEWLHRNFSEKEYKNLSRYQESNIARKFEELTNSIKGHKADISKELFDKYDLMINSIFTLIRNNRNDAGHPIGKTIDRDELHSMIYVFINHCKKIYEFIDFFNTHNISTT